MHTSSLGLSIVHAKNVSVVDVGHSPHPFASMIYFTEEQFLLTGVQLKFSCLEDPLVKYNSDGGGYGSVNYYNII